MYNKRNAVLGKKHLKWNHTLKYFYIFVYLVTLSLD
jgi:hypothetical protein